MLEGVILRLAKRAPEWKWNPQSARRPSTFQMGSDETNGCCCDAACLDHMGQRAHGARAKWSNRAEQQRVNSVLLQMSRDRISGFCHDHWVSRTHY
jgi:hypothetical protein